MITKEDLHIKLTESPRIHGAVDYLPKEHPLANESIYCDECKVMIHAFNNETMRNWIETQLGNYCLDCFNIYWLLEEK